MSSALTDLKVLDIGHFVSGPYCAKLMADLGAEVIKVEEPENGDESRKWGPFPGDVPHQEKSGLFLYLNNNKLGITLNPKSALAKELFLKLVKETDILVENNHPSFLMEMGLDYETLNRVNPELIVTSITPFGPDGPYRDFKASELVLVHLSGIGHGTPGEVESKNIREEPPNKSRSLGIVYMAGMAAATATMFAVFDREISGKGQHVFVSEQESAVIVNFASLAQYLYADKNPTREGEGRFPIAPMHVLPCSDGYIHLECLEEHQWTEFVNMVGNPDWTKNELFLTRESRAEYWDALEPMLVGLLRQWTTEEIYRESQLRGIPCTVLRNAADLLSSTQFTSRAYFIDIDHPVAGECKFPGPPYQFSNITWKVDRPAPTMGQHNEQIFCNLLGYSSEDLSRMKSMKAI